MQRPVCRKSQRDARFDGQRTVRSRRRPRRAICGLLPGNQRIVRGGQSLGLGGQIVGWIQAPRNRLASCRTSSLSILYFNVLMGFQILSRSGHVPRVLFEGSKNKVAFERIRRVFKQIGGAHVCRFELREVELQRKSSSEM